MHKDSINSRQTSIWEYLHFPSSLDVLIVGGGLVGLQAALYITDVWKDARVGIVERSNPPAGASTRNAGFACIGSLGELGDDIDAIGFEATIQLVKRRLAGLRLLRHRIGDRALRYEEIGNVEWFRSGEESAFENACQLLPTVNEALRQAGVNQGDTFNYAPNFKGSTGLSGCGAITNVLEGQLDPGAMIRSLQQQCAARNVVSFRESVKSVVSGNGEQTLVLSSGQTLSADHLILATNAFTSQLTSTSIDPALNQVVVSEPVIDCAWRKPLHMDAGYGYARRIGDRILVGGFRKTVGEQAHSDQFQLNAELGQHLRGVLRACLPASVKSINQPRIEFEWSGVLGIGPTRNPNAMELENGVILAAGLGGMGVALGSLIAQEAASLILARV